MVKYDLAALIAARKANRLSRADIAAKALVNEQTIINFESGKRPRSAWGRRVIQAYKKLEEQPAESGRKTIHDKAWLKSQITAIIRDQNIPVLELPASGSHVGAVLTNGQLYEIGRTILLAVGVNVE